MFRLPCEDSRVAFVGINLSEKKLKIFKCFFSVILPTLRNAKYIVMRFSYTNLTHPFSQMVCCDSVGKL